MQPWYAIRCGLGGGTLICWVSAPPAARTGEPYLRVRPETSAKRPPGFCPAADHRYVRSVRSGSTFALFSLHQRDVDLEAREEFLRDIETLAGPDVLVLATCHRVEVVTVGRPLGRTLPEG